MDKLLTRDEFRESVFQRDRHTCVFCDKPAVDAHHILERRLWNDGGYYLNNGASVCADHHMQCEETTISVEQVRAAAGITKIVLPPHMYDDAQYDKWGNIIQPDGKRVRGELYYDESVQKVLRQGGVLDLFISYVKAPRTYHLPWSDGLTDDDRMLPSTKQFEGKRVIVSEKMDGENTTVYPDGYVHARSIDSKGHPSRTWVKTFLAQRAYNLPDGWRLCGENMFAEHSIKYDSLDSYFYGFGIWNEKNQCLSWDEMLEYFALLGITPVRVLYDGIWDEKTIRSLYKPGMWSTSEGYVVRLADGFDFKDYRHNVGKYVRKGHVMTAKHWMYGQPIVQNRLKEQNNEATK